ncbi:MAG: hypothetical protein SRB2_02552 [Desulfobacteraceae bacterium Eth-SRB2]|nr:MAG: hypothetical protein SRB2_02552 [Desulfobacteraceae bacterium Eth-SRB2]
MAKPILMASIIDGRIHLLNMKHKLKAYQTIGEPIVDADQETVEEYCKKAGKIIINSDFPSSNYYWGSFPKVGRRYLKDIVVREARQNFWYSGSIRAAIQEVGQTQEDGIPKRLISCIMVDSNEVSDIEIKLFGKFRNKISHINSLAAALCAVVAHTENPTGDFMVIAIRDNLTTMAISSPKGEIKIARQLPVGFAKEADCNDADLCKSFFNEIAKDITNTNLYYLQNFQGTECNNFYMLGSPSLKLAMEQHGTDQFTAPIKFGFSKSPLPSLDPYQAAAWAYLFGTLYCHKNYNLLSRHIVISRNINRGYQYAMIAITVAIIGCGGYLYQVEPVSADKIARYNSMNNQLDQIQKEVYELKNQVNTLKKFSGWETFYENTYRNQPAWNTLFSELAYNKPKEIVIESFRIDPGIGKGVRGWNGIITGHIRISEWNQGLRLLRKFGSRLHRSPNFKIEKVKSEPEMDKEKLPAEKIGFDFQMHVKLTSQDTE